MILDRITRYFNKVDTAYTSLYEKQSAFEENPTEENRKEILKEYANFKSKIFNYVAILKNWYPGRNG